MTRLVYFATLAVAVSAAGCSGAEEGTEADARTADDSVFEADSLRAFEISMKDGLVTERLAEHLDPGITLKNWTGNADENPHTSGSGAIEVAVLASQGHAVQGLGGRAKPTGITRLRLKQVRVATDGSLGTGFWGPYARHPSDPGGDGDEATGRHFVSNPELVTGVGLTVSNGNLRNVVLAHRTYSSSTGCLADVERVDGSISPVAERFWGTQFLQNVLEDVKLRTVVVGVGAREHNDNVESITVFTKTLRKTGQQPCD
jgi:hypothetical protein